HPSRPDHQQRPEHDHPQRPDGRPGQPEKQPGPPDKPNTPEKHETRPQPGDRTDRRPPIEAGDVNSERTHLQQSAEAKLGAGYADFQRNMREFEERAQRDHLSPEEVAKTYKEISKLIDAQGTQPLGEG